MNINKLSGQILMGKICKIKNLFVQSMLLIYRITRQSKDIGYWLRKIHSQPLHLCSVSMYSPEKLYDLLCLEITM